MVFDRRPDEVFMEVTQRALEVFKSSVQTISTTIRSGDDMLGEMNDALTGGRPRFGETPTETFENVFSMLTATLEDAREKKSAAAPSVVQKSREILAKVNAVEPAWRSGPSAINSPSDVFRMALRDLRASNSLIRLAQGTGEVADLEQLGTWADDLTKRLNTVQEATGKKRTPPARRAAVTEGSEPKQLAPAKKTKKDTTPKNKPADVDVAFAKAVAEEYNDDQVRGWAKDFASGKISEQQWISRLTTHAASTKDTLDDIFDRAGQRLAKEQNANSGPTET